MSSSAAAAACWWETVVAWIMGTPMIDSSSKESVDLRAKGDRIEACLAERPVNLWELRELALSKGGFLSAHYRQKAWPLLVGLDVDEQQQLQPPQAQQQGKGKTSSSSSGRNGRPPTSSAPSSSSSSQNPAALLDSTNTTAKQLIYAFDEEKKMETSHEVSLDLIRRDVGRSVVFRYSSSTGSNDSSLAIPAYASERLAQALEDTIKLPPKSPLSSVSSSPDSSHQQQQQQQQYHYYQGLHDVAGVVLHQLDYQADLGTQIMQRLAHSHWRDALRENFGNVTWILQHCFLPLVERVAPMVYGQLQGVVELCNNLVLPWMITWFTHDIFDAETAGRLVDAFMASHPLLPLYVSVALVTHSKWRDEIVTADPNDPTSLFVTMKLLPKYIVASGQSTTTGRNEQRQVTVQELLDDALEIFYKYPPRSLLDMVDPQLAPRALVLQRANSISLFQAVRSWNLRANSCGEKSSPASLPLPLGQASTQHIRAKVASGVPLLMQSVGPTWMAHRQRIHLRQELEDEKAGIRRRRRPRPKLQKWKRLIWGK